AEQVLAEGKADFIAIGRGLLAEPEWVNKVQCGRTADIMPCIGCHEGCLWQMIASEPTSCSLNPMTGHETEWQPVPLKKKRSLLVVGGGPAGIEAARVGAERGFDVTLWEATERVGGNLWPASRPGFKRDLADYISYLKGLTQRMSAGIVLNKQATVADINAFGADHVVLATGAQMEPPPFDPAGNIMSVIQVLNGTVPRGNNVLVMGAGVIGCETAIWLAGQEKKVALCARRDADELDTDMVDHHNREMLMHLLQHPNITILRGTIPVRIEGDGVIAAQKDTEIHIPMDSLVFAGRLFSQNELSTAFDGAENVISIGDCVAPNTVKDAVWGGFHAVRKIELETS
ncbi:MAG: FAD-dependent oxidoreductase, partial [Deltaproteobacteria bacterium]|nr:FAD-dependent oxidoreductase [Deltaproteobacteria bacterium]